MRKCDVTKRSGWRERFTLLSVVSILGASSTGAGAQQVLPPPPGNATVVDPAAILEQERRRQQQLAQPRPTDTAPTVLDDRPTATVPVEASRARFVLRGVHFSDSKLLPPDALQAVARRFIGQTVDFTDLSRIVEAVNKLYVSRGIYTGRAILPPQTIHGGVVEVRLVEGRIGAVKVSGADARRSAFIERRIHLPKDSVADVRIIESEVLRFNSTQDAQLRASLQPGSAFGATDVALTVNPPRRLQLDVLGDTNGYASTGRFQGGAALRVYDVLGVGDRLAATALASGGLASGSLTYNAPVGTQGTRIGISGSYGGSHVIAGPYAALGVDGRSATAALTITRPLLVTGRWTVSGALSGQFTGSTTNVADTRVSDARVWTGDAGVTASYTGGRVSAVAQATIGPAWTDERLLDLHRTLLVTRGNVYLSWLPSSAIRLRARTDWQYIPQRDVIGTLEYQIGGIQSARAFRAGSAAGDSGYFASLEAGHPVAIGKNAAEIFGFVDRAQVFSNFPNLRLMSAGAGISATLLRRFSANVTLATPIDDNLPVRPARIRALATLSARVF